MIKSAGSGSGSESGSVSQSHGSADPDPDPHQNVMDPQHCLKPCPKAIHYSTARNICNMVGENCRQYYYTNKGAGAQDR
jgi:hypothetical protein